MVGHTHSLAPSLTSRSWIGTNPWAAGLAYTFLVILFGAVVRITGSGAGCGQHWPTCQGEVAHLPQSLETLIELTHRVTSGVSLLVVVGLGVYSFRRRPQGQLVKAAALLSVVFIWVEALIGAALVLLRYVGENDSMGRAVIMGLHLVNTLALTGAMAFAALAWRRPSVSIRWNTRGAALLLLGALGIAAVAASGAVTALGDTLYPAATGEALARAQVAEAHFLERLRGVHPLIAIVVSGGLLWVASALRSKGNSEVQRWAKAVARCIYLQLFLGLLNVWLSAPGWMQVVHLGAALALWLCWVALSFAVLAASTADEPTPTSGQKSAIQQAPLAG